MKDIREINDANKYITAWDQLVAFFPEDFEKLAKEHNVMKRNRADKDLYDATRVLFIHLGIGCSLIETAARAQEAELGTVSSVALFHRLKKFGPLFKDLCHSLMNENHKLALKDGRNIKLVDATVVKESGKSGMQYRFHYCFSLPEMTCDYTKITPTKGVGSAETFKHFPVSLNDLYLGDAGYCHFAGIEHIVNSGGDVCVRVNKQALRFYLEDDTRIDLQHWLMSENVTEEGHAAPSTFQLLNPIYHCALCFIRNAKSHTHHCSLYQLVGWSSLHSRRNSHLMSFIYKTLLFKLPEYLTSLLSFKSNNYST